MKWDLFTGILATLLGVGAVITGHISTRLLPEMGASGWAARFVGVLLMIMGLALLANWLKKSKPKSN